MRLFSLLLAASSVALVPALHAQAEPGLQDQAPAAASGTSPADVWQSALAPRGTGQSAVVFSDPDGAVATPNSEPGDAGHHRWGSRPRDVVFPVVTGLGIYAWAAHGVSANEPARKAVRIAPPSEGPGPYDPVGHDVPPAVTATPEPGTIALFATGLIVLIPVMRRRRRA